MTCPSSGESGRPEHRSPDGRRPLRTALFYSCKGGSGRTLTLANIASLLARLGYDVLCIDLDLEAPGLLEALGAPPAASGKEGSRDQKVEPGFLEYAMNWLKERKETETAEAQSQGRVATPRQSGTQQSGGKVDANQTGGDAGADSAGNQLNARPVSRTIGEGRVRVIKAGDYISAKGYSEYASTMRAGFLETLYAPPPSGRSEADATEEKLIERYEAFWQDLRTVLTGYQADYLLIDTRTGFSPLSATTIDAFLKGADGASPKSLDIFVFTERGSEASRIGTQEFVRQIAKRSAETAPHPRLTVVRREEVLAEGPDESETREPSREEWLYAGDDDLTWTNIIDDPILMIRSDPEVERTGVNLSSQGGELVPSGLLDDYVELTARLVPDKSLQEIRNDLELSEPQTGMDYKLFRRRADGSLENIADSQRNISFTVHTFHLLVRALLEVQSSADPSLANIGADAGRVFAANLLENDAGDTREAVKDWLKIDSSVGWGLFELTPPDILDFSFALENADELDNEKPPRVTVTNNLGFAPDGDMAANLCWFLGGYIGGILSELVGTQVVTKPSEHSVCHSRGHDHCEFVFRLKDQT